MPLVKFLKNNRITDALLNRGDEDISEFEKLSGLDKEFLERYAGTTFENGLLRIHTNASSLESKERIHQYFNEVNPEEFVVFGFDWLGRELAIGIEDTSLEGAIILFDPATGEYYTLEIDLKGFLNEVMVDQRNETFAFETFNQWLNQTGYKLKFSECVGFKVLLFLGGDDVIENFEVYDFDVYWELNRQTFEQIS